MPRPAFPRLVTVLSVAVAVMLWPAVARPQAAVAPKPAAPSAGAAAAVPADAQWHDVTTWGVEGRGWGDQERKKWFDRFPAKAEGRVTDAVWNLSRDSCTRIHRAAASTGSDNDDAYVRELRDGQPSK